MILDEIVKKKEKELREKMSKVSLESLIEVLKRCRPELFRGGAHEGDEGPFKAAVSRPGRINLIAEIKGRSPSQGVIRESFDPREIASIYETNGAAALSILTDEEFFGGSLERLEEVRRVVSLPLLRKDFIIDEYQIYEAALFHADAILLIVRILKQDQLREYLRLAASLGMDALVEVHSEEELERALEGGAAIVGINNRDLTTFKVSLETTLRMAPRVPAGRVVVSESGISSVEDVKRVARAGVNAILVGSALMKAKDPAMKMRELLEPLT